MGALAAYRPHMDSVSRHYAIGDVHGRFDLLTRALAEIGDLEAQDARLVMLGDYVDRGPQSREVIDELMRRSADDRVVCLRGNHEEMMVAGLKDPDAAIQWLVNGGSATLASYGGKAPPEHVAWLRRLPVSYETEHQFFVHAGVRPGVPLDSQKPEEMVWIRRPFLDSDEDFGKHVVHGHTPAGDPELRPNRSNLDTGAFKSGTLTVGVFDGPGGPVEVWAVREDGVTKRAIKPA
jgi:serine/threonine protein phosphatase 1